MASPWIWAKAIGIVLGVLLSILAGAILIGTFGLPELWAFCGAWLILYRFCLAASSNSWMRLGIEVTASVSAGCGLSLFSCAVPVWQPAQAPLLLLFGIFFTRCHPRVMAVLACIPAGAFAGALIWQLWLSTVAPLWAHAWFIALCGLVITLVFSCSPAIVAFEGLLLPSLGVLMLMMSVATLAPASDLLTPLQVLSASPSPNMQRTAAIWAGISTALLAINGLMMRKKQEAEREQMSLITGLLPQQPDGAGDAERGDGMNMPAKESGLSRIPLLTKAFFDEDMDLSGFSENERKLIMCCRQDEETRNRVMWGGGLY